MEISVQEKYFNLIKNKTKTIELRLFDDKRKNIKIGDKILLSNNAKTDGLTIEVTNLYISDSFENLVKNFDIKKTGFNDIDELNEAILEFYTKEKQKQYGVVGIEFIIL